MGTVAEEAGSKPLSAGAGTIAVEHKAKLPSRRYVAYESEIDVHWAAIRYGQGDKVDKPGETVEEKAAPPCWHDGAAARSCRCRWRRTSRTGT